MTDKKWIERWHDHAAVILRLVQPDLKEFEKENPTVDSDLAYCDHPQCPLQRCPHILAEFKAN